MTKHIFSKLQLMKTFKLKLQSTFIVITQKQTNHVYYVILKNVFDDCIKCVHLKKEHQTGFCEHYLNILTHDFSHGLDHFKLYFAIKG